MTLKEIVRQWLDEHGYDGLYREGECGCLKDDLMPCDNPSEHCEAGYRLPCENGEWDFLIGPREDNS